MLYLVTSYLELRNPETNNATLTRRIVLNSLDETSLLAMLANDAPLIEVT